MYDGLTSIRDSACWNFLYLWYGSNNNMFASQQHIVCSYCLPCSDKAVLHSDVMTLHASFNSELLAAVWADCMVLITDFKWTLFSYGFVDSSLSSMSWDVSRHSFLRWETAWRRLKMVSRLKILCTFFCHRAGSCMPVPKNTPQASLSGHGMFCGAPRRGANLYREQTNKQTPCIIVRLCCVSIL